MAVSNRARVWPLRGRAADLALAVGVAVVVIVGTAVRLPAEPLQSRVLGWLLILVAGASLYFRRRFPVVVALVTLLACGLVYSFTAMDGPILLTFVVALYTVAAEGNVTAAVILGVAAMLAVGYGEVQGPTRHLDDTSLYLLAGWMAAVVATGGVARNRRAYLREAEQRVLAAEREKEGEAQRRAMEERLRIAQELHDVLGHNISLINVQASAALHRIDKDPDQAEEALTAIKGTSKDALRELRTTLGVLRQVDEEAPMSPPPSLTRLDELVDHAASAGLDVRTEIDGDPRPVPPEVDLAGYRIVQEALTNVTRHADATSAVVRIRFDADDVRVEIDDDGRGETAGLENPDIGIQGSANQGSDNQASANQGSANQGSGISGMSRRARALGGELTAENGPQGGFRVHARLPVGGRS